MCCCCYRAVWLVGWLGLVFGCGDLLGSAVYAVWFVDFAGLGFGYCVYLLLGCVLLCCRFGVSVLLIWVLVWGRWF